MPLQYQEKILIHIKKPAGEIRDLLIKGNALEADILRALGYPPGSAQLYIRDELMGNRMLKELKVELGQMFTLVG